MSLSTIFNLSTDSCMSTITCQKLISQKLLSYDISDKSSPQLDYRIVRDDAAAHKYDLNQLPLPLVRSSCKQPQRRHLHQPVAESLFLLADRWCNGAPAPTVRLPGGAALNYRSSSWEVDTTRKSNIQIRIQIRARGTYLEDTSSEWELHLHISTTTWTSAEHLICQQTIARLQ